MMVKIDYENYESYGNACELYNQGDSFDLIYFLHP